ncbi:hypothetical protein E4T56_gene18559 [Termitomyces sp. T112]|nr:hypothetical protein E4T56_gene18559 [Termitomyces sp. T112]
MQPLPKLIPVYNINRMPNEADAISSMVNLVLCYWNHAECTVFAVTSLNPQPCFQPAHFPRALSKHPIKPPSLHPPSASTLDNSNTSPANPNSPLANSDAFSTAVNAFLNSSEPLGPSLLLLTPAYITNSSPWFA